MAFQQGEHPRLFFNRPELADLRRQAQHGLRAKVLQHVVSTCRNLMDPSHPEYLDFRERQTETWRMRKGIFRVLPALQTLCIGYAFTGDTALADFARDAVMTIIEHGLADVKSQVYGEASEGWRRGPGHDKGKFCQTIAWVYDFCYDRFTEAQRARFVEYARECIQLSLEWWRFDWSQVANNRGVRGLLGPMWLSLALEGDSPLMADAPSHIREGEFALDYFIFNGYDVSGAPFEGPAYGSCLNGMASAALAVSRRGGPNLLKLNRFERLVEYYLYEMLPGGGWVNCLNDAELEGGSVAGCLFLMGTDRGQLVPWVVRHLDLHPFRVGTWLEGSQVQSWLPPGENLLHFLLWWRDDAPARTPEELGYPKSHCFRGRGVASMRTGWAAEDWLLTHFCGRQEIRCHRQGDQNHVALYALGERFLVDAGYGGVARKHDMTKKVDRWFGETDVHNCVLVDGMNQRGTLPTPGWAEGEMLDFVHSGDFDTTLGDASAATGPDHAVLASLRRVVLVRRGPAPFVAVIDVNEKDGAPFLAEHLWHTDLDNRVEVEGNVFRILGKRHSCLGQVLWPAEAQLTLADSMGRPQVRVAVRAAVAEAVTVFCPLRAGEDPPRFACRREGRGRFVITCERGGQTATLHAAAATEGPLRAPVPVRLEATARG